MRNSLIQIADVTGAWGVSFLVALISGVLVLSIPPALLSRWGLDLVDCAPVGRRGFVIPTFSMQFFRWQVKRGFKNRKQEEK